MPTEGVVLGFTNPWYKGAVATAQDYDLDGTPIRVVAPSYFIATKFVAVHDRGESDYYGSHDLEDILAVVDGRPTVADDINHAEDDVRGYLQERVEDLLANDEFINALPGHVERGRDKIVLDRLRSIAGPT